MQILPANKIARIARGSTQKAALGGVDEAVCEVGVALPVSYSWLWFLYVFRSYWQLQHIFCIKFCAKCSQLDEILLGNIFW